MENSINNNEDVIVYPITIRFYAEVPDYPDDLLHITTTRDDARVALHQQLMHEYLDNRRREKLIPVPKWSLIEFHDVQRISKEDAIKSRMIIDDTKFSIYKSMNNTENNQERSLK